MGRAIETRDPTGATQPLQFYGPGQAMPARWSAEHAVREGLLRSPWVYGCAFAIAEAIAGLPFRAGPDPDDRTNFRTDAPLARLLGPPPGGPAPKMSARRLFEWGIVQYLVTGRLVLEIETTQGAGRGEVVGLWPLVSAKVDAVPTKGGSQWFSAFDLKQADGGVKRLPPEAIFYAWRPSALDFRQPESVLESVALDVSIQTMIGRYGWGFLKNDARPAGVVVTPEFADADSHEAFKRQWASTYQGPDNAGKLAFLEVDADAEGGVTGSIEVKTLGLSQRDSQMMETQEAAIRAICTAFGVPLTVLGDASGRTFSNADAEERIFWTQTVLPLVANLEDAINQELAPRVGTELGWFDTSHVEALQTRPAPVTSPSSAPDLVRARLMTIDEARTDYGLPPLDGGAGNRLMTADEIAALNPSPVPALTAHPGRALRALPTHRETRVAVDSEERRAKLWKAADAHVKQFESLWLRALKRMFEKQRASTVKRIRGQSRGRAIAQGTAAEAREGAEGVFDPGFHQEQTAEDLRALYEAVASGALGRVTDQFGVSFDLEAEFVQSFIEDRANQLAGLVTDTTYQAITEQLAEGVEAGESVDDLADRIEAVFDDAVGNRAEVIARTEVISASNGAAMEAVGTLGPDVVAAKEWLAARDSRTRDTHGSADGQVVPVDQPFAVGGAQLAYPGDPAGPGKETISCRCAVAFLTPDEVAE